MSLKHAAQYLASHGRGADSMLMHVAPDEVARLQRAAQARGGSLTINPHTGLPEADIFSEIGKVAEKALPFAAAYFLGPEIGGAEGLGIGNAAGSALAAGATSFALTGSLNKGLQAGLLAYGGAGLGEAATGEIAKQEAARKLASAQLEQMADAAGVIPTELTKGEAFKAGIKGIGSLGPANLAKFGGAALLGSGLANKRDQGIPSSGSTAQGYIRPKYYDYRTQTFYDLPAVKSSDWGGQNLGEYRSQYGLASDYPSSAAGGLQAAYAMGGVTDDGMAGGGPMMGSSSAFDFQQHSEPVVRMADGGETPTDYQNVVNQWFGSHPDATNQQVANAVQSAGGLNQGLREALAQHYDTTPERIQGEYNNLVYRPEDYGPPSSLRRADISSSPSLTLSEYVPPPAPATPSSTPSYTSPSGSSGKNTRGLEAAAKIAIPALNFINAAEDVAGGRLDDKTINKILKGFDVFANAPDVFSSGLGSISKLFADGGVARFDDGGGVSDAALTAYQAGDYAGAAKALSDAGMSAQDVVSKYNLSPTEAATVAQNLGYKSDLSGLTYGSATPPITADLFKPGGIASQIAALEVQGVPNAAQQVLNPYTQYSQQQIGDFFTNPANANVNVADAIAKYHANPAAVNQYITGLAADYRDPTATQRGTGYLQDYLNLTKAGMTPEEYAAAARGINKDWGTTGYWNPTAVTHAYDVAQKVLAFDPITDKVTPSDKEWVAFMDKNQISVDDISRATGLSKNEVQARYDAAKEKPVVTTTNVTTTGGGVSTTGGGRTTDTYTGGTTTTPETYRPPGATNPYGNYINPGDITRNVDSSLTVHPNIPGRPYGGFTGMGQVRDAYTAGGGNLGQVLAPTRDYLNTGASADAYNYLMGKADWKAPVAPNKYKPPKSSFKYMITDDGRIVVNPDYVDPTKTTTTTTTTTPNPTDYDSTNLGAKRGGLMDAYDEGGETLVNPLESALDSSLETEYKKLDSQGLANSKRGKQLKQELDYRARMKMYQQDSETESYAMGGISDAHYNLGGYSDGGRLLRGPGDGVSDSIPATIGNRQPARLADGEFVVPARIVSELGNGSTEAGARKLYAMMDRVQKARGKTVGKGRIAKNTRADKYLPA